MSEQVWNAFCFTDQYHAEEWCKKAREAGLMELSINGMPAAMVRRPGEEVRDFIDEHLGYLAGTR